MVTVGLSANTITFCDMLQLFESLSAHFPEMRIRWAYVNHAVDGLEAHITTSLGQDLVDFKQVRLGKPHVRVTITIK